jgi:hypothetical protein
VRDWNFNKVIPAHFAGPVKTNPAEFKRAFSFVYEDDESEQQEIPAKESFPLPAVLKSFVEGLGLGNSNKPKKVEDGELCVQTALFR